MNYVTYLLDAFLKMCISNKLNSFTVHKKYVPLIWKQINILFHIYTSSMQFYDKSINFNSLTLILINILVFTYWYKLVCKFFAEPCNLTLINVLISNY